MVTERGDLREPADDGDRWMEVDATPIAGTPTSPSREDADRRDAGRTSIAQFCAGSVQRLCPLWRRSYGRRWRSVLEYGYGRRTGERNQQKEPRRRRSSGAYLVVSPNCDGGGGDMDDRAGGISGSKDASLEGDGGRYVASGRIGRSSRDEGETIVRMETD